MKLFHGSQTPNIKVLQPYGKDVPRVYFSEKRENTVVYLCNAVERFCKETGFCYDGKFATWGPYGFHSNGILCWEEYYPNALEQTFKGGKGYIYTVETSAQKLATIPFAYTTENAVEVISCEEIADVYKEMLLLEKQGKIRITRYENIGDGKKAWLKKVITEQFNNPNESADYKYFLQNKFDFLK